MQGYMYPHALAPVMRAPQTTIYMDAETKAAIDAARGYMSRSAWIRRAIFAALDKAIIEGAVR